MRGAVSATRMQNENVPAAADRMERNMGMVD